MMALNLEYDLPIGVAARYWRVSHVDLSRSKQNDSECGVSCILYGYGSQLMFEDGMAARSTLSFNLLNSYNINSGVDIFTFCENEIMAGRFEGESVLDWSRAVQE